MQKKTQNGMLQSISLGIISGIMLSITPLSAFDAFAQSSSDQGTVIIEQKNVVYKGVKRLGKWGLATSTRSFEGTTEIFTSRDKAVGNYSLTITPPAGAASSIEIYEDDVLTDTVSSRTALGKIHASGGTLKFVVTYDFIFTGNVSLTSKPSGLAFDLKRPNGQTSKGNTPAVFENVVEGTYTVYYKLPKPCPSPRPISRTLQTTQNSTGRLSFEFESQCKSFNNTSTTTPPKDEVKTEESTPSTPKTPTTRTNVQSPIRVSLSTASTEVAVGGRARLNVVVLNKGNTDLKNLTVQVTADRTTVSNLQSGGSKVGGSSAQWTIGSLKAGAKWETSLSAELGTELKSGETIIANVTVNGDDLQGVRSSQRSASTQIGAIKVLPQTGASLDIIILFIVAFATFCMFSLAGMHEMMRR